MTDAPGPREIAQKWWWELQPERRGGGDRAALARLRRAPTVLAAAMEPEALELCRRLGRGPDRLEPASLVAAVLAHVREDSGPSMKFARQLGKQPGDKPAPMSWLRFRRLIQASTPDEQLIAFRRAVALANRKLNVTDLAESLLDWGDKRRQRWLYAYYDVPPPYQPSEASGTQAGNEAP